MVFAATVIAFAVMTTDVMAQRGRYNAQPQMQGQGQGQGFGAGMMQNRENWEPGQRINAILNLTDEQEAAMKDLRLKHMNESLPIRNKLQELRAKLQTLRTADKVDMKAINNTIDEMAELRAKQAKLRETHHQDIRNLLTDEQRIIFDNHQPRRMGSKGFAKKAGRGGRGVGMQGQGRGFCR